MNGECMNLSKAELKRLAECSQNPKVHAAASEYLDLKMRRIDPDGRFDRGHRFYLTCQHVCCAVRRPSRNYPFSQLVHGRTALHVSYDNGIPELQDQVIRYANLMNKYAFLKDSPDTAIAVLAAAAASSAMKDISRKKKKHNALGPTSFTGIELGLNNDGSYKQEKTRRNAGISGSKTACTNESTNSRHVM